MLLVGCLVALNVAPQAVLCVEADGDNHFETRGTHDCPDGEAAEASPAESFHPGDEESSCSDCRDVPHWSGATLTQARARAAAEHPGAPAVAAWLPAGNTPGFHVASPARHRSPEVPGPAGSASRSPVLRC